MTDHRLAPEDQTPRLPPEDAGVLPALAPDGLRGQRFRVWAWATTAALLLIAAVVAQQWSERTRELAAAALASQRGAARLADELSQALKQARVAIAQTELQLQRLPAGSDARTALGDGMRQREQLLAAAPLPLGLHALDNNGRVIKLSDGNGLPDVALHRHEVPQHAPATAVWRVEAPQGAAGQRYIALQWPAAVNAHGIAAYAAELDHAALLARFDKSRAVVGGAVTLFRADPESTTTLLARIPHVDSELGQRVPGLVAKALTQAPSGCFEAHTVFDGQRRVVAYHRLPAEAAALVVVHAVSTQELLASWTRTLPQVALITALIAAAMLAGGLRLDRVLQANASGRQKLQRSENHFRALADNLPDVVVRLDQWGRQLYASPSIVQLTGQPAQTLLGRSYSETGMAEDTVTRWAQSLDGALRWGRAERLEFSHDGPQGLRHWEALVVREPQIAGEGPTALVISRDVTDRHRALAQLRDSEERLRLALAAANQGLYDLDLRTGHAVVSPEYARMLGYEPDEFTESHEAWRERLHPDDRSLAFQAYDDYIAGSSPEYRVEFRQRSKDGHWCWILSLGKVQERGANGQPLRMLGTHTDITAMRQAQAELRRSEQRFRLAASYGQVWEWDFGAGQMLPAATFFNSLSYPTPTVRSVAEGLAAFEHLLHPDDYRHMKEVLVQHLHGQGPYQLEFRARDAQQCWRWFQTQGQAVFDASGRATYMAGTTFEITERREAEDAVRQLAADLETRVQTRTAELARSEARHRAVFETVPVAVIEEDWSGVQRLLHELRASGVSDGPAHFAAHAGFVGQCLQAIKVVRFNRRAAELQALAPGTASAHPADHFHRDHQNRPQFVEQLQALWLGQRQCAAPLALNTSGAQPMQLVMTATLPALDDGDGSTLVCLVDISEVDRLNAELSHSLRRLRSVNQDLETFTYSVSHDLKAPLRGIDGYSRLLLLEHQQHLDEEGRRFLGNIRSATQHMGKLIDDLLAYSRLERRELSLGRVALLELTDHVVATAQRLAGIQGLEFVVDVAPDLHALCDAQGLTMALRNLVDNAVKFSRDSQPARIRVMARRDLGKVLLSAQDNGPGFDMKFHDRIFGIFQRLHRAEDFPGTGVGLAIVRKAMERMGGQARAVSQVGQGATFTLELPEAP